MKKILIPILTTAAITPVVATSVSCGSAINLMFKTVGDQGLFYVDNFNIEVGKKYTFDIKLSEASETLLDKWESPTFIASDPSNSKEPEIIPESLKVKLNGKDITKDKQKVQISTASVTIIKGSKWTTQDKIIITVSFKNAMKKGGIYFGEF